MATLRRQFVPSQLIEYPVSDWLSTLGEIVERYGGDVVTEVDALLVKVMGDFAGGMVLKKVLAWLKTVKRDYIWKSDSDWDKELGLSYSQMRRLRDNVLSPVIYCWQKSARNRTTHYKVMYVQLIMKISKVLGVSMFKLNAILGKPKNASSGLPGMQSKDSRETLTKKPTNPSFKENNQKQVVVNEDDSQVVKALIQEGLSRDAAEKFEALGIETVQDCIGDAQSKRDSMKIKKSYQSYLVGALNNQMQGQQKRQAVAQEVAGESNAKFRSSEVLDMSKPSWAVEPEKNEPDWWRAVRGQLEMQLPVNIWSYISRIDLVDDADEIVLRMGDCPERIALTYQRNIERLVKMVTDKTEIRFEEVQ